MARISTATLSRYLLQGRLPKRGCLRSPPSLHSQRSTRIAPAHASRQLHTESRPKDAPSATATGTAPPEVVVPLRKQLKEEAKKAKLSGQKKKKNANNQVVDGWELTVGIEIHAQLNTARKLFSRAATSFHDEPNTHVAYFDLATPGSQPVFQPETLIPALRAALVLGCDVRSVSRFDRKHYFHWDQPSGYQITQYYEPFARDGRLVLRARDGIAAEDGDGLVVRIQQVQMEQDTAKTTAQPGDVQWIDYNRTGSPLVEIITRPDMHHPATAAALVRKVQTLLSAVDACVSGMEAGGLRADVNVSVRRSGDAALGTRTEIKNLSSFRAVEDAIIAERDRQIAVLEAGGVVEGETRGWSIGSTETRRLRGKEGEVDYRYMPDPDLAPVVIGDDLVRHLRDTMGELPDAEVDSLIENYQLTPKDALSLVGLDGGYRVEYFWNLVDYLSKRPGLTDELACFQLAANWNLHELDRLAVTADAGTDPDLGFTPDGQCARVPVEQLGDLFFYLHTRRITAKVAKQLLARVVYQGEIPGEYASVAAAIETEGLWFDELSDREYEDLAAKVVEGQEHIVRQFASCGPGGRYPTGKLMFLVGRMIQLGPEERIDPKRAEGVMRRLMERLAS